ncbi:carbohydrate ABC transporter membrane protein 2, CUT1 family [Amycolatopsis marina]|uniref:Carbohydrate ABC transporter membrane protein 2, CUT1 family n=1 Tax=Amycolatopsis marina TaxID=490629 RepID=A0A1I0X2L9_9PSEU|nr:carbohydrate ABC transporter permease [Amycolatopsis marina]SFA95064.1 carbohydrate ABC transporter membrane protein 2, CUT1 family [Amycolatopsis marina]
MSTRVNTRPRAGRARRWLPYLGVAVIVAYCLAPFYWMVVSSFRRTNDIFDMSALPSPWSLENYRAVFSGDNEFGRALLNSFVVAGVTTIGTVVLATFAAYALARLTFRFKNAVLAVVIATSMFPGISLLVPLLKLFTDIGWINTYQSMIVPNLSFALPLAIWYLTTFFRQLPAELEEAARVDGCSRGQAFRKVILPIAVPGVFTTAIIVFVVAWNEFIIALTMVNLPEMQTATVRISQFVGFSGHDSPFGTKMAAGVIATVPLVIAVLLFQRRIVAGLTSGGVK